MNETRNAEHLFPPAGLPPARHASDPTAILSRFSDAVDKRLAGEAARLFARDGVFRRAGEVICGRANIESFYWSRMADPGRITRHVWSNVTCQPSAHWDARVEAVLTTYAFEPQISQTHLQLRVGNVVCRCVPDTDEGWVFAEHAYERLFVAYLPLSPTTSPNAGVPPQ